MKYGIPWCLIALVAAACGDRASHSHTPATDGRTSEVDRAVAILVPVGESGVTGTVLFERAGDRLRITGEIRGLTPGLHGFHVHEYGDLSDMAEGESAGDHFMLHGMPHGAPSDQQRHTGDLGNVEAGQDGVATLDMTDGMIELEGDHSIVGRSLVVHAQPDRFTQPSGGAGGRVAFGVIGIAGRRRGPIAPEVPK